MKANYAPIMVNDTTVYTCCHKFKKALIRQQKDAKDHETFTVNTIDRPISDATTMGDRHALSSLDYGKQVSNYAMWAF